MKDVSIFNRDVNVTVVSFKSERAKEKVQSEFTDSDLKYVGNDIHLEIKNSNENINTMITMIISWNLTIEIL